MSYKYEVYFNGHLAFKGLTYAGCTKQIFKRQMLGMFGDWKIKRAEQKVIA